MQAGAGQTPARRSRRRSPVPFLIAWIVIIMMGTAGAWLYSEHMKQQITAQIEAQTARQIAAMENNYEQRIKELDAGYSSQIAKLQSEVDSLNELLTFTKDNASNKTDNSNKLYTQLSQVQKQLDELKRKLDMLK
ncbi:hypothetical protein VN24_04020 [Paenibacillus beijingensis]|uniref:Uncharacterized protein n=1 Tax=Paenibacillus beijingensis TaxID=1126833 RepID=A0A0D5NR47_9BACL|nr:hypothetical protein VN24_04020 [Paenibacillus beijingensis]